MQNWCDVQFLPSELSSELFEVLCIKLCVLLFSMSFMLPVTLVLMGIEVGEG